jgi:hypothetical protein
MSARLAEITSEFMAKLQRLSEFEAQIIEKTNLVMDFATNLVTLKQDTLISMYESFRAIQQQYEDAINAKMAEFTLAKEKAEARLETLRRMESDRMRAIDIGGIAVLAHADEFCESARYVTENIKTGLVDPSLDTIENNLLPGFSNGRVTFRRFRSPHDQISQKVEIDGNTWRVKLGHTTDDRRKDYLSLFIELAEGYPEATRIHVRAEIECPTDQSLNVKHEFTAMSAIGESRGWKRFHPLVSLQTDGYVDASGSLSVIIGVRPESYFTLCKWLDWSTSRKREKARMLRTRSKGKAPEEQVEI